MSTELPLQTDTAMLATNHASVIERVTNAPPGSPCVDLNKTSPVDAYDLQCYTIRHCSLEVMSDGKQFDDPLSGLAFAQEDQVTAR